MDDIKYNNTCKDPLALCSTSNKDKFWIDDYKVLYENNEYLNFVPQYKMSRNQQLNAISRLCFYMIIILLLFNRKETLFYIPITILIIIIMFNKLDVFDMLGRNKELSKIFKVREEDEQAKKQKYKMDAEIKYKTFEERTDEINKNKDYTIKTGFYDSNGDLVLNNFEPVPPNLNDPKSRYTVDELQDYEQNTCLLPTNDNPLMNIPTVDYGKANQPVPCNADDDNVNDLINVNFNHELFRDVDELWDKKNSQRQFYTLPNNAIPNMQNELANWLYKQPEGTMCKDVDMSNCIKFYDDLRYRTR